MIISASRRTDIPAHYSDWFFRRLAEGSVLARNPVNPSQARRIGLRPEDVGGIVFWSKNPAPMLGRLRELGQYRYYFQFTLTPYGRDIEPGVPDKGDGIETFRWLSGELGAERVIWRYDPILFNPVYTPERHVDSFARLASALGGCTRRCTLSFIDPYKSTRSNAQRLALMDTDDGRKRALVRAFASAAAENGIALDACAEAIDLADLGVGRARCVDAALFNALWGLDLPVRKDRNQRPACRCTESADIGAYNTCPCGCLYCYANYNPVWIDRNRAAFDPLSPSL